MRGLRASFSVNFAWVLFLGMVQTAFAQWETLDSSKSAAPAVKKMSPYRERMYREKAELGNTIYAAGSITSWVGLGAFWGGLFTGQGAINSLGFLAVTAGIPVMGVGAGKIHYAAQGMNPDAPDVGGAGWPLWGAGVAAHIASLVVIGANVEEDENQELTIKPAAAYTALGLFAGGQLLYYAGWFQFSRRRAMANSNFTSVSVLPTLHFASQKVDGVGIQGVVGF